MDNKNSYLLLLFLIVISINLTGQNENYWIRECNDSEKEGCGYIDKSGKVKIEFGKYPMCYTDTMFFYAIVLKSEHGLIGIDKNEKELFQVWTIDNGPDYISEGLFRIIKNNKIGFANEKGEIVISPDYEMIYPFNNGLASFCEGCISVPDEQIPEYTKSVGGSWGFIDKRGTVVIKPEYTREWNQELREFHYKKDDSVFIIRDKELKLLNK